MKRKIFFDWDGTLLNSSNRMFNLFCELNARCNMTYAEYWKIKRSRISQKEMLMQYFNYTELEANLFHTAWLENIEREDLLSLDTLFDDTVDTLDLLAIDNDLYVVTARQKKEATINQLIRLNILKYFKQILITEQKISKLEVIRSNICDIAESSMMIGDTKEDIKTGEELNIKKFAISTGMLDYKALQDYNADKIYRNLKEFREDICL